MCLSNIWPYVDFLSIVEKADVQGMTHKIPFLTVNLITSHDENTWICQESFVFISLYEHIIEITLLFNITPVVDCLSVVKIKLQVMMQLVCFLLYLMESIKYIFQVSLQKFFVYSIVLTDHWNYFMVEYLTCCEGGKVPWCDAGEAPA